MIEDDTKRYTMRVKEVAARLTCSRQTVHDLADSGELHFQTKKRGQQNWKYFDPAEVEQIAHARGVETPEVLSGATTV